MKTQELKDVISTIRRMAKPGKLKKVVGYSITFVTDNGNTLELRWGQPSRRKH